MMDCFSHGCSQKSRGNPTVVLIHPSIAFAPVVELAGSHTQPVYESSGADFRLFRPAPDEIHYQVPHVMGTHTLVRAPQDFFLRRCARPSIRPAPRPWSESFFPEIRFVVVRLGGPAGSCPERPPHRSQRILFANGRTPLAAAHIPRTDRKPALYPASAALGWQPSLPQCSAFALSACALSVILTEERSLHFQLRQDNYGSGKAVDNLLNCGRGRGPSLTAI